MKKIVFTEGTNSYRTFDSMLANNSNIGFLSNEVRRKKYIITQKRKQEGEHNGIAVNGEGWLSINSQKSIGGEYFAFEKSKHLYLWLSKGMDEETNTECFAFPMKKLTFYPPNPGVIFFDNYHEMRKTIHNYIGFQPKDHQGRFILITSGTGMGLACSLKGGTWSSYEDQPKYEGNYFLFDDKKEFTKWLLWEEKDEEEDDEIQF